MAWNVLILGAGAIGTLIGAKLAAAGTSVILVGRPNLVQAVYRSGLRISEQGTVRRVDNLAAVASLAEAYQLAQDCNSPYNLVVLTVKSYDTGVAVSQLYGAIHNSAMPPPLVLSLQNGVGNEEEIVARMGEDHVIAGTITAPVSVLEPAYIRVEKPTYRIGLSPWTATLPATKLAAVESLLGAAGFAVTRYPDARGMKWTKLLLNMVANATSAILNEPPRRLLAHPCVVDLEIGAWQEALRVMHAATIRPVNVSGYPVALLAPLLRGLPRSWLRRVIPGLVGGARGDKMPSLQLDLSRGKRQSEVAWLNGAVVRQGREVHVATPVNSWLNDTLLTLASNREEWAAWEHNHQRLCAAGRQ